MKRFVQARVNGGSNYDSLKYPINKGVLQGDPLSSVIFNACMASIAADLNPKLGILLSGRGEAERHCAYLQYADDTVLISRGAKALELNLSYFVAAAKDCGMTLNALKCASVRIEKTRKTKTTYVETKPFLRVDDEEIPAMNLLQTYKYLGMSFSPDGLGQTNFKVEDHLKKGLGYLSLAKLDPQQRLFVVRRTLIPQVQHALVLGDGDQGFLGKLDVLIRSRVRQWLHLPHDTPLGYFHAKPADGGLGVPNLATSVCRWRRDRYRRLEATSSIAEFPLGRWLLDNTDARQQLQRGCKEKRLDRSVDPTMTPKVSERDYWRERLVAAVDGGGLNPARDTPKSSKWVTELSPNLSGKEYVRAVHVRGAILSTPVRKARQLRAKGRLPHENPCRCSSQPGSLAHILQQCGFTSGLRINRHDRVVETISSFLKRKGWKVWKEPVILRKTRPPDTAPRTPSRQIGGTGHKGSLKPDIVCHHPTTNRVFVIDPTIVSDALSTEQLSRAACDKHELYNCDQVRDWCAEKLGLKDGEELLRKKEFQVHGVPISWRGLIHSQAYDFLRKQLGMPIDLLSIVAVRTLTGSWSIWNTRANNCTQAAQSRTRAPRHPKQRGKSVGGTMGARAR